MNFVQLVIFMINLVRTSTQTALDRFFNLIEIPQTNMTQQSFSEARQKLKPEACRELFLQTVKSVYSQDVSRWHGMVVIAIDGSKIQLPDDKQLLKTYGGMGPDGSSPTAQASVAYDILNNIIVDADIEPLSISEHELVDRHLDRISNIPGIGVLMNVLDRGYSSYPIMAKMNEKGMKFLIRLRRKFNLDIDALGIGIHDFVLNELSVRVIKFVLPSGETETLVTNLFDARMKIKAFKQLYFMRWGVETQYGKVKLKFEIENFSGRTAIAIQQDFYITTMLSNLVSIGAQEAQPAIDFAREGKGNKYRYKVNMNQAIGTFKDCFILALLDSDPEKRIAKTDEIIKRLSKNVIPDRKGRSRPRNPSPRKARFHHNQKSNC